MLGYVIEGKKLFWSPISIIHNNEFNSDNFCSKNLKKKRFLGTFQGTDYHNFNRSRYMNAYLKHVDTKTTRLDRKEI